MSRRVLAALVSVSAQQATLQCQDLDPRLCPVFHDAKPDMCNSPTFSQTMCKRFCGNCPVECYSCSNALLNPQDCNTTRACKPNEQCVTRTMKTKDGRTEYLFGCEMSELCGLLAGGFGKRDLEDIEELSDSDGARYERDVLMRCCVGDLCNVETQTTTTKSPTTAIILAPTHRQQTVKTTTNLPTTTTQKQTTYTQKATHAPTTTHKQTTHRATHTPTTANKHTTHRSHHLTHHPTTTTHKPAHPPPPLVSCKKDIVFIMETRLVHTPVPSLVGRATQQTSTYRTASQWIPFIQQIVSRITIGKNHSHVAAVTFGHRTRIRWDLDHFVTQTDVQNALTHLEHSRMSAKGRNLSPAITFNRTAHEVFLHVHGDRYKAKNVVVVLDMGAFDHNIPNLQSVLTALHNKSHNVIEINVGSVASVGNLGIATNRHQKFHVPTFQKLHHLLSRIISLICA